MLGHLTPSLPHSTLNTQRPTLTIRRALSTNNCRIYGVLSLCYCYFLLVVITASGPVVVIAVVMIVATAMAWTVAVAATAHAICRVNVVTAVTATFSGV